jgi:hypothetical protein
MPAAAAALLTVISLITVLGAIGIIASFVGLIRPRG